MLVDPEIAERRKRGKDDIKPNIPALTRFICMITLFCYLGPVCSDVLTNVWTFYAMHRKKPEHHASGGCIWSHGTIVGGVKTNDKSRRG